MGEGGGGGGGEGRGGGQAQTHAISDSPPRMSSSRSSHAAAGCLQSAGRLGLRGRCGPPRRHQRRTGGGRAARSAPPTCRVKDATGGVRAAAAAAGGQQTSSMGAGEHAGEHARAMGAWIKAMACMRCCPNALPALKLHQLVHRVHAGCATVAVLDLRKGARQACRQALRWLAHLGLTVMDPWAPHELTLMRF